VFYAKSSQFIVNVLPHVSTAPQNYRTSGRSKAMCDYSLMSLPNRLAICGEELVVHRFEPGSVGLISAADLKPKSQIQAPDRRGLLAWLKRVFSATHHLPCPAVCVPPGARLLVRDIARDLQRELELPSGMQEVVFTQIGTTGYRDAIRFANGVELLLQRLREGQTVRVLALTEEDHDPILRSRALVNSSAGV
jgi:hypothetical protein